MESLFESFINNISREIINETKPFVNNYIGNDELFTFKDLQDGEYKTVSTNILQNPESQEFWRLVVRGRGTFCNVAYQLKFGEEYRNMIDSLKRGDIQSLKYWGKKFATASSFYETSDKNNFVYPMVVVDGKNKQIINGHVSIRNHDVAESIWEEKGTNGGIVLIYKNKFDPKHTNKNFYMSADNDRYVLWIYEFDHPNIKEVGNLLNRLRTKNPITIEECDKILNAKGKQKFFGDKFFSPEALYKGKLKKQIIIHKSEIEDENNEIIKKGDKEFIKFYHETVPYVYDFETNSVYPLEGNKVKYKKPIKIVESMLRKLFIREYLVRKVKNNILNEMKKI